MNPEPQNPRDEMEQRLTALLLGELPAEETAALHRAMEQDGELAKLFARLHHTVGLVRETVVSSPGESKSESVAQLKLSPARREKLLAHFKTVTPREFAPRKNRPRFGLVELAAVLVILGLLAAMLLPALSKAKSKGRLVLSKDTIKFSPSAIEGSDSPTDSAAVAMESVSRESLGYFTNSSALSVADFEVNGNAGGLAENAPPPARATTPIALPEPAPTSDASAGGGSGQTTWALNPADQASAGRFVFRYAYDSAGGGGGSGGGGQNLSRAPILEKDVQLYYDSAAGLPNTAGAAAGDATEGNRLGFTGLGPKEDSLPALTASAPVPQTETRTYAGQTDAFYSRLYRAGEGVASGGTVPETPKAQADASGISRVRVNTGVTREEVADLGAAGRPAIISRDATVLADADELKELGQFNKNLADQSASRPAQVQNSLTSLAQDKTHLAGRSGVIELPAGAVVADGGRIATEPEVQSVELTGYTTITKPTTLLPLAVVPRQGVPMESQLEESRRSQSVSVLAEAATEPSLSAGSQIVGAIEAKTEVRQRSNPEALAEMERVHPAREKEKELADALDVRRLLTRKLNNETIDLSLPKSSQVEIIESADPKSAPAKGVLGTLFGAASGNVERVASIKSERDSSDIAEFSDRRGAQNSYDPYFAQTESEAIKSEAVLGKVVEELRLDEAWAGKKVAGEKLKKAEAIAMLKDRLEVSPRPNTTILDIRAKSSKPEEAAALANAVASAYKLNRLQRSEELVRGGVKELQVQLAQQDAKVRQLRAEIKQLDGKLDVQDADVSIRRPGTNAPIPQPEILTSENNFSTFSLNVSDVSFKLAAASLAQGQMPEVASIRSEEFINAFDYRDPEPAAGMPIAFAWERARYPFAHNRDLLRFSLKTAAAGRQAGRPLNIVLLLDNSGSMERADRVRTIREALRVLATQLQPQDKLSVITFARTARLVVDGFSGDRAGAVADQIGGLTPQGGTNLEEAMNLAYQTAAKHYLANGINRVVLLTDGAANLGDVEPDSLKQKVEAQRKQGIALDCFGIGWDGLNDDLLEVLARNGDGRYGFINSPEEAATDFVGQLAGALKVAAADVKVQVEFNSKRVTSYRQIGYAKHQLTKEQFRDNTVDAAEIAAQEAGNALYTVELNPSGVGPIGTVRVRYKVPGTMTYREQAWDVAYTGNALSLEQSSPALRLAASASAFAEWLVASPFAGEVTLDALLQQLRGVPEVFGADSRPTKLEWMIRQAKSLEGK